MPARGTRTTTRSTPAAKTPPRPTTEQRILTALADGTWMDIRTIHTTLTAQDGGSVDHEQVVTALSALVQQGHLERVGLTPPRWRATPR